MSTTISLHGKHARVAVVNQSDLAWVVLTVQDDYFENRQDSVTWFTRSFEAIEKVAEDLKNQVIQLKEKMNEDGANNHASREGTN